MSTIQTGKSGNVTTPITATITGTANNGSGLIRAATSAAHLFGNNDRVQVTGATNGAQGIWRITVIDATHFDLQGSTFSSSDTGTATDWSLTPQVQLPTDGDAPSMQAALLSSLQALLDRTQYLQDRVHPGSLRLVGLTTYTLGSVQQWTSGSFVAGNAVTLGTVAAASVQVGDVFEAYATGGMSFTNTGSPTYPFSAIGSISLSYSESGGAQTTFGSQAVAGAYFASGAELLYEGMCSLACAGTRTVAAGGAWVLAINGQVGTGPASTVIETQPPVVVVLKQWRAN